MKTKHGGEARQKSGKTRSHATHSETTGDAGIDAFDVIEFADPAAGDFQVPDEKFMEDPFPDPFGTEGLEPFDGIAELEPADGKESGATAARRGLERPGNPAGRQQGDNKESSSMVVAGDFARKSGRRKSTTQRNPGSDTSRGRSRQSESVRVAKEGQTTSGDVEHVVEENSVLSNPKDCSPSGGCDEGPAGTSGNEGVSCGAEPAREARIDTTAVSDHSDQGRKNRFGELAQGTSGRRSNDKDDSGCSDTEDLSFSERSFFATDPDVWESGAETGLRSADISQPGGAVFQESRFPLAPRPYRKDPGTSFADVAGHRTEPSGQKAEHGTDTPSAGRSWFARPEGETSARFVLGVPTLILAIGVIASAGILVALDPMQVADRPTGTDPASIESPFEPASMGGIKWLPDGEPDGFPWQAGQMNAGAKPSPEAVVVEEIVDGDAAAIPFGKLAGPGKPAEDKIHDGSMETADVSRDGDFHADAPLGGGIDLADWQADLIGMLDLAAQGSLYGGVDANETPFGKREESAKNNGSQFAAEVTEQSGRPVHGAPFPSADRSDVVEALDQSPPWTPMPGSFARDLDKADRGEGDAGYHELSPNASASANNLTGTGLSELGARIDMLADVVTSQSNEIRELRDLAGEFRRALAMGEAPAEGSHVLATVGEQLLQLESRLKTVEGDLLAISGAATRTSQTEHSTPRPRTETGTSSSRAEGQAHFNVAPALGIGSSVYDRTLSSGKTGTAQAKRGFGVAAAGNRSHADGYSISTQSKNALKPFPIDRARIGDFVRGYGKILDIVTDDIGGHLVVMERGTVYVRR